MSLTPGQEALVRMAQMETVEPEPGRPNGFDAREALEPSILKPKAAAPSPVEGQTGVFVPQEDWDSIVAFAAINNEERQPFTTKDVARWVMHTTGSLFKLHNENRRLEDQNDRFREELKQARAASSQEAPQTEDELFLRLGRTYFAWWEAPDDSDEEDVAGETMNGLVDEIRAVRRPAEEPRVLVVAVNAGEGFHEWGVKTVPKDFVGTAVLIREGASYQDACKVLFETTGGKEEGNGRD